MTASALRPGRAVARTAHIVKRTCRFTVVKEQKGDKIGLNAAKFSVLSLP
jgi:hypothetical protein